ncbi:MAG: pitrilysin family protein [Myxococcales bacterium]|nr:insulinase family protein [Polyangiaceae bacterium]MDW8250305.1 pitrilysin family protein [Myxococcales bacterium]
MKRIVETSTAVPLVSMSLVFRSGSALDPPGKEGLARVTGRMLRRGGAGKTAQQIEEAIDTLGGEFSSEVNFGWTAVGASVLSRNAEAMAELIGALVAEPSFDEIELGKLQREIEAELIESRDSDSVLASRALRREVFGSHRYGRRVSGYIPTLRALTPEDVRQYHRNVFCKKNAFLVFSGDLSDRRARHLAELLTLRLPEGAGIPDPVGEPEVRPGRHLVLVDKPERTQTQMYLGTLGSHPRDDDLIPLQVATSVLGGTFNARMMQEVRVQRGWSYGAYARLGLDRHRELFSMWAAPAAGDAPGCLALLLSLLVRWHQDGVEAKELSFTKNYLRRSYVFDLDTAQKRAQQRISAEVYDLPKGYHETYTDHIKAVTRKQVNQAIQGRINPNNLVIAVVGSHKELGAALEQAIPDLSSSKVVPYDLE